MKKLAVFCVATTFAISTAVALAESPIHPIVDVKYGYLLGGSREGQWVSAKQTAAALRGGETYRIWGTNSLLGTTTGDRPRTDEAPCEDTFWVRPKRNFGSGAVAIGSSWNAISRAPRVQSTSNRFYRNEVARILEQGGIRNPKVVVSQLWRVDLDGDRRDEVLFSATNYSGQKAGPMQISSDAHAGEYSMVLMRKVVSGRVQTIPLVREIYTQFKDFSAPSEHHLVAVIDANGDGKMEIAVRSRYYEGDSIALFEVTGGKAKEVLSTGCGA